MDVSIKGKTFLTGKFKSYIKIMPSRFSNKCYNCTYRRSPQDNLSYINAGSTIPKRVPCPPAKRRTPI